MACISKVTASVCVALLFVCVVYSTPTTEKPKVVTADEDYEQALEYIAECKKDLKLTDDDIAGLEKKTPWSQNTKCLVKCVAEKFELFKNNQLVEKEALEWIEEEKQTNVSLAKAEMDMLNTCKKISEKNECDTAAKMFLCAKEIAKKNGF